MKYGIKYDPKDFYIWIDKGGTGKTTCALAIFFKLRELGFNYSIITNQTTTLLSKVLTKDKNLFVVSQGKNLSSLNTKKIIDLEGHSKDTFISDVVSACKTIIMPVLANFAELQAAIASLIAIKNINKNTNFIIIANKVNNEEMFNFVKQTITSNVTFLSDDNFFMLPFSKSFENIFIEKKSISEMMDDSNLKKYHFGRVEEALTKLCKHLIKTL